MHRGYVKLWRKSLDSATWKNPKLWRFFTWCLMKASHKKHAVKIGYQEIELNPGQFIFGRKACALETGLSEQQVRSCVRSLAAQKLHLKPTNKFSIITVLNWDAYQSLEIENNQQITNKQPTNNQQITTNKNVKNVKKKNKQKFIPPSLNNILSYFKEKGYRPDIAQKAFEYYDSANWKDARGNQVKNWKQKMIAVWFKDENKDTIQKTKPTVTAGDTSIYDN